jgi:hypothetical protein
MQGTSATQSQFRESRPADKYDEGVSTELSRLRTVKALFVIAAGASFLFSVYLWFLVDRSQGVFVGLWVPSILALGSLLLSGGGVQK